MSSDFQRLQRALQQPLQCVCMEDDDSVTVRGNTQKLYKVRFGYQITCTCCDHTIRNARCKHILYVLIKLGHCGISSSLLTKITYGELEIDVLKQRVRVAVNELRARSSGAGEFNDEDDRQVGSTTGVIDDGDVCPPCLEDLVCSDFRDVRFCRTCHHPIHLECVMRWFAMAHIQKMATSCPLCRGQF